MEQPSKEHFIFNHQQQDMLRLFKNSIPEPDHIGIKRFIAKMLSINIDDETASLAKEKGWTEKTFEQWGKKHLRTRYQKRKIVLDTNSLLRSFAHASRFRPICPFHLLVSKKTN